MDVTLNMLLESPSFLSSVLRSGPEYCALVRDQWKINGGDVTDLDKALYQTAANILVEKGRLG